MYFTRRVDCDSRTTTALSRCVPNKMAIAFITESDLKFDALSENCDRSRLDVCSQLEHSRFEPFKGEARSPKLEKSDPLYFWDSSISGNQVFVGHGVPKYIWIPFFHTSRFRGKFLSFAFTWPFFLLYPKFTNSLASPFSPLSGPTRITISMNGKEQLDTKTEELEINSQLMISCFHVQ